MNEKQKIIKKMLKMQKQFIAIEHSGKFNSEEYYNSEGDSELSKFKKTYDELATKLVDLAHAEKGSHR